MRFYKNNIFLQVSPSPLVLAAWKPPADDADPASSAKPGNVEVKPEMTSEDATLSMNLAFYTQTIVEGNFQIQVFLLSI